jgi:hypothetical protein
MSRAVNVDATVEAVEALCKRHAIGISTIEPLPAGGTRVVLLNPDGADAFRVHMKNKLMAGIVVRSGYHLARQPRSAAR